MKIYILMILLSVMVYADKEFIIIGKAELSKKYIKYDQQQRRALENIQIDKNCYYENGIISARSCYIPTGNIMISFKNNKGINLTQFAQENNLTMIKLINPLYQTILFKVNDNNEEIINLVNSINKKYKNLKARVEWITPRRLR